MVQLIKKINVWWMSLDPTEQYMYWVINFCVFVASAVLGLVLAIEFLEITTQWIIGLVTFGVIGLVGLFEFVFLWLVFYWPSNYKKK